MQNAWTQHTFSYVEIDMITVGKARNDLARICIEQKFDVTWYVDDDILVPPHAGLLVQQAIELGVVSGLYFNRRSPYNPQVFERATGPEFQHHPSQLYWPLIDIPKGMSRQHGVGAGCLAVRTGILGELEQLTLARADSQARALGALREHITATANGNVDHLLSQLDAVSARGQPLSPWFEFTEWKGEDLYFCERLGEIGQAVWLNADVACEHLATVPVGQVHFQALKDMGAVQRGPIPPAYAGTPGQAG